MDEDSDDLSNIESRHRKERKELQAKVQALKKAAKNDKTKKKELTGEISRLETELEMKHKEEIEACHQDSERVELDDDVEPTQPEEIQPKLSKAQKRRDKKSQQEKEREVQIKLQEKENLHGPRNIEIKAIEDKLKLMRLKIFGIASDGDCLYKAVSHQLAANKQQNFAVVELRTKVAAYIRDHKEDFIPFMSNPETCDMLTDIEFEDYCDKIKDTKVWGGQLEIRALSNCLKCPITVIQATGPDSIEQGSEFEGPPLIITYHRHMFSLGEHYNSTHAYIVDGDNV